MLSNEGAVPCREDAHVHDDDPFDHGLYVWAYHVTIENQGVEPVQLKSRYWKITDSLGRTQEVRGEGVIGEQPIIPPGESYEYSSGTPLSTPSGIMVGSYYMETGDGRTLEIDIPAFSLDSPEERSQVH
jgi:ApaG protein